MKLLFALLLATLAQGAPVNIVDVLYRPSGNPPQVAAGTDITITQTAFTNPAGNYYPAFQLTPHPVSDAGGNINLWLEPNQTGQPYQIIYRATNGVLTRECWNVPVSNSALKIKDVRSTLCTSTPNAVVQLGQLAQGGALQGYVITWNNTLKRWEADPPTGGGGVTAAQIQSNALVCADDTGVSGSGYVVTQSPAPTIGAYSVVCFKAANTSSFFAGLNVNGAGFSGLFKQDPSAGYRRIDPGDIVANQIVYAVWNTQQGGGWQVLNINPPSLPVGADQGGTGQQTLALHGTVIGRGVNPVAVGSPGTAGWVWTSNGADADPSMQAPSGGGSSSAFQSFILVDGSEAGGWTALAFSNGSPVLGVATAAGPLSATQTIGALLLATATTNLVMVTTKYEASGTVDIGWVTIMRGAEGAPAAGSWNFSVYLGCAANDSNFTYGTPSTLTFTPPATGGVISNYRVTAVNVPASCTAHKPMQVWIFRTADTGGTTGVNAPMVSIDVTQH